MREYILEIKKLIPKNLCEKIIAYFDEDMYDATTVGSPVNKDVRNCVVKNILNPQSLGEKICSNAAQEKIFNAVTHYKNKHPGINIDRISQLDLLKYEANKYKAGYKFHNDFGLEANERHLSISVCLSNEFEGGEFVFNIPGGTYTIPQNVGDAVVFPSNFMFPHQVNQVTRGIRYALIGWVI
tara:strand:+ start:241 stop:789 length:549 start_codon:yes stop_codon:yes gene_type:complete